MDIDLLLHWLKPLPSCPGPTIPWRPLLSRPIISALTHWNGIPHISFSKLEQYYGMCNDLYFLL